MMQNRLLMLLAALVLLVGVAFLVGVFDRGVSTVDVPEVEIPVDRVESLRIEGEETPLVLAREGNRWRLTEPVNAPADSTTVNQLLEDLSDLELGTVVSTNPDRYGQYGVDAAASSLVVGWPGNESRIVVGRQGTDFRSVYVRLGDDPRVFATRERISLPTELDRLRDKTLLEVDPARVQRAEITGPDGTYSLERAGDGWSITGASGTSGADSAAVATWLGRFSPLRADGFLQDVEPEAVQDSTTHSVVLDLSDGSAAHLRMRRREGQPNVAVTNGGDVVFRIQDYRISQIVPEENTLRDEVDGT